MSKDKKIGCALAAAIIATMGFGSWLMDSDTGLTGYALGVIFAGQWGWILRGVK